MIEIDVRLKPSEAKEAEMFFGIVKTAVLETLKQQAVDENAEVSISFVEADEIQALNREYRGKDNVTDVLSFPLLSFVDGKKNLKIVESTCLGDIVICFSRAIEQSIQYGHSLEREIAFLTAHSVLHLLGYDHETHEDEIEMFALQEIILKKMNLIR